MSPNAEEKVTPSSQMQEEKATRAHPYVSLALNRDVVLWFSVKDSTKPPVTRAKHKIMKELIEAVLTRGIGDRITGLSFGKRNNQEKIVFGFNINPEVAMINYIKGPSIEIKQEAAEFRQFWNNMTDCRRFPDLSTCETMYVPVESIADRRETTIKFAKILLEIHLGIPQTSVHTTGVDIRDLLRTNIAYIGTGEEETNRVNQALEELIKKLRLIKSESLEIHSLQGISPVCRGADVRPPISGQFGPLSQSEYDVVNGYTIFKPNTALGHLPGNVQPIEVLLQLEITGIYTDEIEVLRAKRVQMIIELCQLLDTQVGLQCKPSTTYIDVLFDGIVFRLIVVIKREVSLLRQVKSSTSVLKESLTANREAEQIHIRNELLPKLTASLNAISSTNVSFSPVCRLIKRWLSAQCLLDFFTHEAIELIVAQLFINPHPYSSPPNLPVCGFIRCLDLLATFPFSSKPFVVNLNDLITDSDLVKIQEVYQATKHKPGIFIVTPFDVNYGMFSKPDGFVNSLVMVSRVQTLASEWVKGLFLKISNIANPIELAPMFIPTITDAHVILHLKGKFISCGSLKCASQEVKSFPIVNFDPVSEYINVIRQNYDPYALFMYDKYFGDTIYLFWKSEAFNNVKDIEKCKIDVVANGGNLNSLVPNLEGIIENIQLLGQGIVQRVAVRTENWPV